MPTQIAPGVYTKIIDQSLFATPVPGTVGFIPILSPYGIDNTLTFVASQSELINDFGSPNLEKYGQSLYNAFNWLSLSGNLYVIRPLPTLEDTAELLDAGTLTHPTSPSHYWIDKPATFANAIVCIRVFSDVNGYDGLEFQKKLFAANESIQLTRNYPEGVTITFSNPNMNYVVGESEFHVYVDSSGPVQWSPVGSQGSVSNEIFLPGSYTAGQVVAVFKLTPQARTLEIGSPFERYVPVYFSATPTRTLAEHQQLTHFVTETFTFTEGDIIPAPTTIDLSNRFVPGQGQVTVLLNGNELGPGEWQEGPSGDCVIILVDIPIPSTIVVNISGPILLTRTRKKYLDPETDTKIDHNIRATATTTYYVQSLQTTSQVLDTSYGSRTLQGTQYVDPVFIIAAKGRGQYYNDLYVYFSRDARMPGHVELTVGSKDPLTRSSIDLEKFTVSFDPTAVDGMGNSTFIEDVVNRYSKYIQVYCNRPLLNMLRTTYDPIATYYNYDGVPIPSTKFVPLDPDSAPTMLDRIVSQLVLIDAQTSKAISGQVLQLGGGHEGCMISVDGIHANPSVMNKVFANALTGLYDPRVIDSEDNDISIVLDAGFSKPIKNALIELCEVRGDCFAILDLPKTIDVDQTIEERNGAYAYNSWLCALYTPFVKVYSTFEGRVVTLAPSYFLSRVIPYNDMVAEIWFAPAGPQRGTIAPPEQLLFNATSGELDLLYLNQVNPIVYKNKRYMVYGQLTTQRKQSALSDVNIVRLILYLRKVISRTLSEFLFEQNDSFTWNRARVAVEGVLADVQSRRGLYEYSVEVGANEYELVRKTFHVNVYIKPTRVVERILLNFIVS